MALSKANLSRIADNFTWYVTVISSVMLAASVLVYVFNCFMRYVIRAPLPWPEEFSIYIVVLMVYFLQCRLEYKGEQLGIGIIDHLLTKHKILRVIVTLIHGGTAIFVYVVLFKVGLVVVEQQYTFGAVSPVIRVPMGIYFGLVNACFILAIVSWVIRFFTKDYDVIEEDPLIE